MQDQLRELAHSGPPWAQRRAQQALAFMDALARQDITESEYQELMQDLARSDTLNAEADDADIKNLLVSCIMIGARLA
jgi:GrpB-like predicted nucleotidyltransferase (UPF0157 family)